MVGYRNFKGSGITELLPGLSNVENVTNGDKNVTIFSIFSTSLLYVERKRNKSAYGALIGRCERTNQSDRQIREANP